MTQRKVCANPACRRGTNVKHSRRDRCTPCYRYWLKHGHDRPRSKMRRSPKESPRPCAHCRENLAGGHHTLLCNACYQYRRDTGRMRPRHLWAERCKRCGKPRQEGRDRFCKGRCGTCDTYFRKMGVERPMALIKAQAPLGWCDCGRVAVEIQTLPVGVANGHHVGEAEFRVCEIHKEEPL